MQRGARLAALLAGLLLIPAASGGHTRSVSYSSWDLAGRAARVVLRVPQLELTRLPWGPAFGGTLAHGLADYVTSTLRLTAGGTRCPVAAAPRLLQGPRDLAVIEWRVRCPETGALAVETDFLLDVAPSHLHFARVRGAAEAATERVLSNAETSWSLGHAGSETAPQPVGSSLVAYLGLGVEHIATGYDHLAFLFALLLLARRVSEVLTIVTGFTVAHSVTLGLAALGRVQPESAAIEALIGLSIALVASENAWVLSRRPRIVPWSLAVVLLVMGVLAGLGFGVVPAFTLGGLALFTLCYFSILERVAKPARLRFAIAFCFGLVHGFGFAGVLTEMALPSARIVPALLGFNLGVEVGQLLIVGAVWPLLRWLADVRAGAWHGTVVEMSTGAVFGLGVFWLVERAYG